jgi:ADP-ribose pyrophosphatase
VKDDPLYEPVVATERLYGGTYLNVTRLTIRLPDERHGFREVVEVRDAVAVLPIDDAGIVHLVRQNRPAIGRILHEIPAGLIDAGESPEQTAVRECEEEIGMRPTGLTRLLSYAHAEGYSTGMITLFVGTGLMEAESAALDETEFLERVPLPFEELVQMVKTNRIEDSKTIISTLFWLNRHTMELG